MICAIACANKSRYMPHLSASDAEFCESASRTYSTSRNVLRVRGIPALLVLYCLFHPRKARHLETARLLRTPAGAASSQATTPSRKTPRATRRSQSRSRCARTPSRASTPSSRSWRRSLAAPATSPATSSVQYRLPPVPGILISGLSPAAEQVLTAHRHRHRHRIFYLRGEIHGELFPPTADAVRGDPSDGADSNLACDVAFPSTVIILFQPLPMRALSDTKEAELDPAARRVSPSCQLIRTAALGLYRHDDHERALYISRWVDAEGARAAVG